MFLFFTLKNYNNWLEWNIWQVLYAHFYAACRMLIVILADINIKKMRNIKRHLYYFHYYIEKLYVTLASLRKYQANICRKIKAY